MIRETKKQLCFILPMLRAYTNSLKLSSVISVWLTHWEIILTVRFQKAVIVTKVFVSDNPFLHTDVF